GDAPLFFQLHPVGGGGALVFPRGDGAGQIEGTAVEEELFRERGLARVRVRDDRERTAAFNLPPQRGRRGGVGADGHQRRSGPARISPPPPPVNAGGKHRTTANERQWTRISRKGPEYLT